MDEIFGIGRRPLEVHDGRQGIDIQLDEIARVLGDVPTIGNDDGHRVPDEAHIVLRHGPMRWLRAIGTGDRRPHLMPFTGKVGSGKHGAHAVQRSCLGHVETGDPPSGCRAAHERGVKHAR